jgi:hypothetical protein
MRFKVFRNDYVEKCGECPYCQDLMTGCGCAHPSRENPDPYLNRIGTFPPDDFPENCPLLKEQK